MNLQFTLHINTIFSERNVTKIKQFALFVAKKWGILLRPNWFIVPKIYYKLFFLMCHQRRHQLPGTANYHTHTQVFYDYCHSHYNLANVRCHMFDSKINPSTSTQKPKILRLKTSAEKTCLESRAQEEVTARAADQPS